MDKISSNTGSNDDSGSEKANIPPATTFSPSGAPHQTAGIDIDHPAVDNDPRKDTTAKQNRIDFNNPDLSVSEAVEENLKKQGMSVAKPQADGEKA